MNEGEEKELVESLNKISISKKEPDLSCDHNSPYYGCVFYGNSKNITFEDDLDNHVRAFGSFNSIAGGEEEYSRYSSIIIAFYHTFRNPNVKANQALWKKCMDTNDELVLRSCVGCLHKAHSIDVSSTNDLCIYCNPGYTYRHVKGWIGFAIHILELFLWNYHNEKLNGFEIKNEMIELGDVFIMHLLKKQNSFTNQFTIRLT